MGDLLHFPAHRAEASRRYADVAPAFFFDVSCPRSYLIAERVERVLGEVEWVAVDGSALPDAPLDEFESARARAHVEMRARSLKLPLVWSDTAIGRAPRALRAAAYACELGAGAAFALAASRLAFCGGFDLNEPETLAEAAAAAGIPLAACLDAAGEEWRDEELRETAEMLRGHGVSELPAFQIGARWVSGEAGLTLAETAARHTSGMWRPLAPVG